MREDFEALGYPWPGKHPNTGEPFVRAEVSRETQTQVVQRLPPERPTREVPTEWDDDGPVAWRTLSDEELAAAMAAYEKDREEWHQSRGTKRIKTGPDLVRGTFTCESGATAEGKLASGAWHWTSANW